MSKISIGVVGAGHLGAIHIGVLKELTDVFELVGFFDSNPERSAEIAAKFNIKAFDTYEEMLSFCEAVDIVSPTITHYSVAHKALVNFRHVFVEKPITETTDEAKLLQKLAYEANVKVQVGHVERFNPAFTAASPYIDTPMFIESHRLAQFNPRGTDVSVVLDLMIHDIDVILSVVKSNVRRISASGVAVVSDTPDIANARIEFDNGCVANLTASRISLKKMRKTRLFQPNAYISVDFLDKTTEIIKLKDLPSKPEDMFELAIEVNNGQWKQIYFENPDIQPSNAIKEELLSFANSITSNTTPVVSVDDGLQALLIAQQIIDKIKPDFTK